ncbi:MAG: putative alpha/beta-fold hydrolase [Oceanicoccus sp.]|jgi:predicted alpha/beta-fold hydrolase
MSKFTPTWLFKNSHLQTICASTGPRKLFVQRRAKQLIEASKTITLDCGDGIRLQGEYAANQAQKGLVIMIHGWLGSNNSLYLLSAGSRLFDQGYSIFRLNLRDHGSSNHLNRQLFNSTRIDEVVNAVKAIQQRYPQPRNYLCGFSLGGNFSLRVAAKATASNIKLNYVVAVCPVINPFKTNRNLNQGSFIYHNHFRNKWRRSLLKKIDHFPDYDYAGRLKEMKTLDEMNSYFVPNHTAFDRVEDYLNGYSIGGDHLAKLDISCRIISSQDDPVISAADLEELAHNKNLHIELTRYGGHCGYISNFSLESWIDQRLIDIFASQ